MYTPDLTRLLHAGQRYPGAGAEYVVEAHDLNPVVLPTGHVVACDPLVFAGNSLPFTVTTAPGTYSLRAWVAVALRDGAETQRRVAALQLVIRDQPAQRWEMALVAGDEPEEVGGTEAYVGYPSDSGCGTLADTVAIQGLSRWHKDQVEAAYFPPALPTRPVPGALCAVTDEATGANVATVATGWGDGVYPTFIGYTSSGEITCYVTDFMVIPKKTIIFSSMG